jgi:hypothetical protein
MMGSYMNEDKVYGVRIVREHDYNRVDFFIVSIGLNIVFVGGEWTHVSFWFRRQRLQSRGMVLLGFCVCNNCP